VVGLGGLGRAHAGHETPHPRQPGSVVVGPRVAVAVGPRVAVVVGPRVAVAVEAGVGVVCVGSRDHPSKCASEPSIPRVIRVIVASDILLRRSRLVAQGVPLCGRSVEGVAIG